MLHSLAGAILYVQNKEEGVIYTFLVRLLSWSDVLTFRQQIFQCDKSCPFRNVIITIQCRRLTCYVSLFIVMP